MKNRTEDARDVMERIKVRLRQRYARWLVRQPVNCSCRTPGWRSFWRGWRRRQYALGRSRVFVLAMIGVGICGGVVAIGLAVAMVVAIAVFSPKVFFAAPPQHAFADSAERAAVAFTRLTALQTLAVPLLLLLTARTRPPSNRLHSKFYKGRDRIPRRGWRIGVVLVVIGSVAVSWGAALSQPRGVPAAILALLVIACQGWLVWGVARRLIAVRLPGKLSDPGVLATMICVTGYFLMWAVVLLYRPIVLKISQSLDWLGPLGWINASLLRFSQGHFERFWPFVALCVLMAYLGRSLIRYTRSWAFRRRLLIVIRAEQFPIPASQPSSGHASRATIAGDVRTVLSGNGRWSRRTALQPDWLREKMTYLIWLGIALLAVQLLFGAMAMFLWHLRDVAHLARGDAFREELLVENLAARVAGWSVLSFELPAALFRDFDSLATFARRPVSPGGLWIELQRRGLKDSPFQLLFSLPFLVVPALFPAELSQLALISIGIAFLTCVGIRTAICATVTWYSTVFTLREWLMAPMFLLFAPALVGLIIFSLGRLEATAFETLIRQVLLIPASLAALGAAWGMWHLVSHPRRMLRHCW